MTNPQVIVAAESAADHCTAGVACKTLRVILRFTLGGEEMHRATELIIYKNFNHTMESI